MQMAHFRVGGLASLIILGSASIAAAQAPVFTKVSEIVDDNGSGVNYTAETSYLKAHGAFGSILTCCPSTDACTFALKIPGGQELESVAVPIAATPQTISAVTTFHLTGPSQLSVTLSGYCSFEFGGKLYFPEDFTTSYNLEVEKPTTSGVSPSPAAASRP
jgi:hypothetical protein